tara:strand:- start:172 stop:489 length:318 start_codon:yes stop_codon:yes gene_type:complete
MAEKKCTFSLNGEVHSRGVGEKDCAAKQKAFNKFKKERDARSRELLGMTPKDTTATKNKNIKSKKKTNFLQKIFKKKTKEEKLEKAKLKKIKDSRKRNLDRNATN